MRNGRTGDPTAYRRQGGARFISLFRDQPVLSHFSHTSCKIGIKFAAKRFPSHSGEAVTLVERKSGYLLLGKVPNLHAATVRQAAARRYATIPAALRKTLTLDNGKEFADHETLEVEAALRSYFDSQSRSFRKHGLAALHRFGQLEALAARTVDKPVGRIVIDELFFDRVPLQTLSDPAGDVRQMTDADRPMANLDVGRGLFPRPNAVDPVLQVPLGLPEGRLIAPLLLFMHLIDLLEQLLGDLFRV
jgi:hypothetical protein